MKKLYISFLALFAGTVLSAQNNNQEFSSQSGVTFTVGGNNLFDLDLDGCESEDSLFSNLKLVISNNPMAETVIADESGTYSVPISEGPHNITPVLEMPAYFEISPTSIGVNFPTDPNPFNQNFCITPVDIHSDMEVAIFPMNTAMPGFDANYKIIYRNKGNQTISGTVMLNYTDDAVDYVSSTPAFTDSTPNVLSWDVPALQPFQTDEINVTFNLNSTSETPPINSGDVLDLTATITPAVTDESMIDNSSVLHQTVANIPADIFKAGIEGTSVTSEKIGEFVYYIINFKNTGSAAATNVVVQDMIDLSKFNISSLIPLDASHAYSTRITEGNMVIFEFPNINLPSENGLNEGYIAYKIRLLPSLLIGDVFTNNASVSFDGGTPIATNTTSTTIEALSINEADFSSYFTIYPNPAMNTLNIISNSVQIESISVFDLLGHQVLQRKGSQGFIDISQIASGTYFIKIEFGTGTANSKFIKL